MISRKLNELTSEIEHIAEACGRERNSVRLVAVSKRFPVGAIQEAKKAGQLLFGENYIQEALEKHTVLGNTVQFHFIGHLQTNKAAVAARIFSMIETIDRVKLARKLNKKLLELGKKLDILIQVNIGHDDNKSGIAPEHTEQLLQDIADLEMLRPRGLMTMPPFSPDPEDSRIHFRKLRELADALTARKLFHDNSAVELSMGMTNDYKVAIEEGATLVRIGTAIFGERSARNMI